MVSFPPKDYIVNSTIENFKIQDKELDFGDFEIISVKQGPDAKEWKGKLGCKGFPKVILIKDFPDYVEQNSDISGFAGIINSMSDLLLAFRLFRVGDIIFGDYLIEDKETEDAFNKKGSCKAV